MTKRQYFSKQSTIGPLLGLAVALVWGVVDARAVDPNPLQSAYWRFEEGPAGSPVPASTAEPTIPDTVLDSINDNHLQAWRDFSAPTYIADVPPTPLKSGLANTLSLEFDDSSGPQDMYTVNKKIDNGYVVEGGGFTLEAAFNVSDTTQFRTIVAKEGHHHEPDEIAAGIWPTLKLTVRGPEFVGDPDEGKLQIELFDGVGTQVSVSSPEPLGVGEWYYAAVVDDGETLSLYLDRNDENGYALQGQVAVDGALYQGTEIAFDGDEDIDGNDFLSWQRGEGNNIQDFDLGVWEDNFGQPAWRQDWQDNWTVGRGDFLSVDEGGAGSPDDSFRGMIDEVRLTNTPLDPSEFLFAKSGPTALGVPEPAALGLAGLALAGALLARRRRPR